MTRKSFIENSLIMGIGMPLLSSLGFSSCSKSLSVFPELEPNFSGKVIIIGAGAAGLAAGYLLKRYNIDFTILEAAPVYGGRIKEASHFADFPIDLGAEWIHTDPIVLAEIVGDLEKEGTFDSMEYNPKTIQSWRDGKLRSHNLIRHLYSEWKFKHSTWYRFFDQQIVPHIRNRIELNQPVRSIDYSGKRVMVQTQHSTFEGDKVLVTTSIATLQQRQINFTPALPVEKQDAINRVFMGDGIKIFVAFKERFYPDILAFGRILQALREEDKFVYDAALGKSSQHNVLGLFAINDKAAAYTSLGTEQAIIEHFLAELDDIFDGKASANYIKHIIQNWSNEPYIQGAYAYHIDGNRKETLKTLQEPINNTIFFAGEALSIENQAMVHGACESAYQMAARMITA